MKTIAKLFSILSFAAALSTPLVAAAQQAPAPGSATISDPGSADRSGFVILIEPSGHAWALDGAGHTTGTVNFSLTQTLFNDLAAASPLASLPVHTCAQALVIGWNAQRSANLACSADARAVKLMDDVAAIQRALYVHSYRTTAIINQSSTGETAAYTQPPAYSVRPAAQNSTNYQPAQTTTYTPAQTTSYTPAQGGSYGPSTSYAGPSYSQAGVGYNNSNSSQFAQGLSGSSAMKSDFQPGLTQSFNAGHFSSEAITNFSGNSAAFSAHSSDLFNGSTSSGISTHGSQSFSGGQLQGSSFHSSMSFGMGDLGSQNSFGSGSPIH